MFCLPGTKKNPQTTPWSSGIMWTRSVIRRAKIAIFKLFAINLYKIQDDWYEKPAGRGTVGGRKRVGADRYGVTVPRAMSFGLKFPARSRMSIHVELSPCLLVYSFTGKSYLYSYFFVRGFSVQYSEYLMVRMK